MKKLCLLLVGSLTLSVSCRIVFCQSRPPATPLITHDPYFSIWSTANRLTGADTTHWTGSEEPILGMARIDGQVYRFMGANPKAVPAIEQVQSSVTATHTRYQFRGHGVEIDFT